MDGISNIELEKLAQKYRIRLDGVLSKDKLIDYLHRLKRMKNFYLILNLQNLTSDSGGLNGGTHWIGLVYQSNHLLYFDSFGFVPPIEVLNLAKKLNGVKQVIYNEKQIQAINTDQCGIYSLLFIDYCQSHKELRGQDLFNKFLNEFDKKEYDKNDMILKRLTKKYF